MINNYLIDRVRKIVNLSNEGRCFSVLSRACDKEKLSNPHEE